MSEEQANVEILKTAFKVWNETRGGSIDHWLSILAEDVDFRSLAEGEKGLEFTSRRSARDEVAEYLQGLVDQLEMIHYTVDEYVAQDDRVIAIGRTAWKNRVTGKAFDTPKVDVVRFRDGQIVEFFELYDTAMVLAASEPSIKDIIQRSYDARRREDVDEVLTYFDSKAKFRIVASPELGVLGECKSGHDELRPAFETLFQTWDWTNFLIKDIIVGGDKVVVHSGGEMRHTPSGTDFNFETLDILKLKDGKIIDFIEFFDTHLLENIIKKTA